uniref:NADH:ubiquinone oxidoreductase intermediate-associated protein 30 domain-containing protein n=1 Tax=Craspedostauros australis TaxID=1486917 RepID=A0A7R9WXT7_9STRA
MLYQAAYEMPSNDDQENGDGWKTIKIPFEDFQLVSGPKMVPDGKPLNTTGGIYQIGLALSKFQISDKTSELPSFRPGYFEVQVREIGLFWNSAAPGGADAKASQDAVNTPDTLSKKESLQKRPMPLKLLLPLARIFVNEQR